MRILAIYNGEYGQRHIENITQHAPPHWEIFTWKAAANFPLIIDYPEDFIPPDLPQADLVLSFAEQKGVAELLPEIAQRTSAKAVIAAIDNEAWLPRGLARQLRGWLERIGVACATPKPLCSLTESDFGVTRRQRISYHSNEISEFARHFGHPQFQVIVNELTRCIIQVEVQRDSVCGCARFVANGLIGVNVEEAEEKTGLLHHHYPCLASMGIDVDFDDTLLHVSGNIFKDELGEMIKPYKRVQYIAPGKRSED